MKTLHWRHFLQYNPRNASNHKIHSSLNMPKSEMKWHKTNV